MHVVDLHTGGLMYSSAGAATVPDHRARLCLWDTEYCNIMTSAGSYTSQYKWQRPLLCDMKTIQERHAESLSRRVCGCFTFVDVPLQL